jgi:putative ABC transport system permease protein
MPVVPTDVRQALRRLAATPLLSIAAVVTLALGVGSAVVMADVLDRLLLRYPDHVAQPERVARVYVKPTAGDFSDRFAYRILESLGPLRDEFEASAVFSKETVSFGRGLQARQIEALTHSRDYFAVWQTPPLLGAWPTRDDAAAIGYGLWQDAFGGSPHVLGRALTLGRDTYTIVAVAPRGFNGVSAVDAWLPLEPRAKARIGTQWKTASVFLQAVVRLRPDSNRVRASERVTAAWRATAEHEFQRKATVVLGDLRAARAPGVSTGARIEVLVAGLSLLVLLVTCGNVASLLLVRGLRRGREFMVKTALGATRARLLAEVWLEGLLLSGASGVAALAVVLTVGGLIRRTFLAPPAALASPLDPRLIGITVLVCAASALLLGVGPAFSLTTRRAVSPGASAALRPSRLLDLFSGLQMALSLPLIVAAALFVISFLKASGQDLGMQTARVAVLTTNLQEGRQDKSGHEAIHREMQRRVAALPQVESTALVETLPMRGGMFMPLQVPGRSAGADDMSSDTMPTQNAVDPSFFAVMKMRLVAGRFFTEAENRQGVPSRAVVTAAMAAHYWPNQSAVGRCFYIGGKGPTNPCTEIVGVVADARLFPSIRPTTQWASAYYLPIGQAGGAANATLLASLTSAPAPLLQTLRREAQAAGADLPYVDAFAFDEMFESMLWPWRTGATVFMVFGVVALIVAAIGLAVVGAYAVTRRTREIGIRAALGAQPQRLVGLVLARSLFVVAAGVFAGVALAWAAGSALEAQMFDVPAREPRVLLASTLIFLVIGAVAAWLPARRAARIDPVIALRSE